MSYIAPNGNIWILRKVPIDKTYQNTLYWPIDTATDSAAGRQAQRNYFIGTTLNPSTFVKYTRTNQSYSRHEKGSIRVDILADNMLDCNYLVFQNSSFGVGKYFYAFITGVEYVNNSCTVIRFEIDVIQTWYFDFDIEPCFVERMHIASDARYINLVPEPLEPGEYIYQNISHELVTKDLVIIIAVVNVQEGQTQGRMYGNIYGGCTLFVCLPNNTIGINNKISEYITSPDSIVAIYMAPKCLIDDDFVYEPGVAVELTASDVKTGLTELVFALPDPSTLTAFGSYTPHNKKLYSYPFTMLEVYTPEGAKADYRYEFFNNNGQGNVSFKYGGSVTSPVELLLVPTGYKIGGASSTVTDLTEESISMKDYPLCSWNVDAYKAWVAQNAVPLGLKTAAGVAGLLVGVATGGIGAAATTLNLVNTVTDLMSQQYQASIQADQMHGQSKGSANISSDIQGFYFAHKVVNETSARMIDSFFDRFGYAVKQILPISRKTRKYFTYIKTVGCTLKGAVPSDDEDKICTLHDNGITYWDTSQTTSVGDFSLASGNTPIL